MFRVEILTNIMSKCAFYPLNLMTSPGDGGDLKIPKIII